MWSRETTVPNSLAVSLFVRAGSRVRQWMAPSIVEFGGSTAIDIRKMVTRTGEVGIRKACKANDVRESLTYQNLKCAEC